MITETKQVAGAISNAAEIWPELASDRSALLRKIIEVGIQEIDSKVSRARAKRLQNISSVAGGLSGVWPKNWREDLGSEWPA